MGRVICYGYEEGKLWIGRVTLKTWLKVFFGKSKQFEIKPLKRYEVYAYYKKLILPVNMAKFVVLANKHSSVFEAIAINEDCYPKDIMNKPPYMGLIK